MLSDQDLTENVTVDEVYQLLVIASEISCVYDGVVELMLGELSDVCGGVLHFLFLS